MKTRIYYIIHNTQENSVAVFGKDKINFYDKGEAEKACKFANKKNPEGKYIIEIKTEQYDDTKKVQKVEDEKWGDFEKPIDYVKPYKE